MACTRTVRNTVKANSSGRMAATTLATSSKIILRALVLTLGVTSVSTPATGRTTRWKVPEHLLGLMVASTTVNGSMESKMVSVLTHLPQVKQRKVSGAMESVLTGSMKNDNANKARVIFLVLHYSETKFSK